MPRISFLMNHPMLTVALIVFYMVTFVKDVLYKIPLLIELAGINGTYKIYPWMEYGQVSSSSLAWIGFHIIMGASHLLMTILNFIYDDTDLRMLHQGWHWIFLAWIIPNLHHFGEASLPVACIANCLPLIVMSATVNARERWKRGLYLAALSSAPALEFVLYLCI